MPVRKIVAGHRSCRGFFWSPKNDSQLAYESTFERDFFYLLELNKEVLSYEEQPILIELTWGEETWLYTPDVMVRMRGCDRPLIYEVKPLEDDFPVNKKKAMNHWCRANGFRFEVIDAKKIRTPELKQAKALYQYLRFNPSKRAVDSVLQEVASESSVSVNKLVDIVGCRLGDIYYLIASNKLSCDGIPSRHSMVSISKI